MGDEGDFDGATELLPLDISSWLSVAGRVSASATSAPPPQFPKGVGADCGEASGDRIEGSIMIHDVFKNSWMMFPRSVECSGSNIQNWCWGTNLRISHLHLQFTQWLILSVSPKMTRDLAIARKMRRYSWMMLSTSLSVCVCWTSYLTCSEPQSADWRACKSATVFESSWSGRDWKKLINRIDWGPLQKWFSRCLVNLVLYSGVRSDHSWTPKSHPNMTLTY